MKQIVMDKSWFELLYSVFLILLFFPFIFCPFIFKPAIFLSDGLNVFPQIFCSDFFIRRIVFLKSLFFFFHFVKEVNVKVRSRTMPMSNQRPLRILSLSSWLQRQEISTCWMKGKSVEFAFMILLFLCKRIMYLEFGMGTSREILALITEKSWLVQLVLLKNLVTSCRVTVVRDNICGSK